MRPTMSRGGTKAGIEPSCADARLRQPRPRLARRREDRHLLRRLVLRDRPRRLRVRGPRRRRRRPRRPDPLRCPAPRLAVRRPADRPLPAPHRAARSAPWRWAVVLAGAALAAALDAPSGVVFVFPALFAVASCAYGPAESALIPGLARTPQELSASNVTHSAMENGGFLLAAIVTGVPARRRPRRASSSRVATARRRGGHRRSLARCAATAARTTTTRTSSRASSARSRARPAHAGRAPGAAPRLADPDRAAALRGLRRRHSSSSWRSSCCTSAEGSVGFLNASWGIGALVGGACLALLLDRGRLVVAIAGGSLVLGAGDDAAGHLARAGDGLRRLVRHRDRLHLRRGGGENADAAARLRRDDGPGDRLARIRPAWRRWRSARSARSC